jgi:hypothetical protein
MRSLLGQRPADAASGAGDDGDHSWRDLHCVAFLSASAAADQLS